MQTTHPRPAKPRVGLNEWMEQMPRPKGASNARKRDDQEDYLESLLRFQDWCMDRQLPWKREMQKLIVKRMGTGERIFDADARKRISDAVRRAHAKRRLAKLAGRIDVQRCETIAKKSSAA
jgi:hypothetical protein